MQIERRRTNSAAARATRWPRRQSLPPIRAGDECVDWRNVRRRRSVLEITRKERPEYLLLEVARRVAVEIECAQGAAVLDLLPVMPRTHDEKDFVVVHIFR